MVRAAGATEVHMRIAAPPTSHPCFYGIDTPQREELLASKLDVEGIARHIGVDSLAFISIDGLYRAMGEARRDPAAPKFCDARSEEHTSALQSLMRISYAVFCLTKKNSISNKSIQLSTHLVLP